MSHTTNTSPFRCFNGDSSSNDVYSTNGVDQSIETTSIGSVAGASGSYIGFRFRSYANDRGMWAHCSQSWTSLTILASMTCADYTTSSTTVRSDQSLMSSLKGYDGGAFNFGDDAVFFFKSGGTTDYSGVKPYAAYNNYYPSDPANADSNFAALIFTDAT